MKRLRQYVRIVLDTGIFVSALITKNTPPGILYSAWQKRLFQLITSDAQLEEMERVFRYKKLERFIQRKEAALLLETVSSVASELKRREQALYECALEVEADESLNDEMKDWEVTQSDGLDNETW